MSANFITALKAEIAEIEATLRADPRHRKLARLRETLAEYEPAMTNGQAPHTIVRYDAMVVPVMLNGTKQDRIKAELTNYFQHQGPNHRTVLLDHLKRVGLMGQEKDPMAALAAYLSGWKDTFAHDGKGLWGLSDQLSVTEEAG